VIVHITPDKGQVLDINDCEIDLFRFIVVEELKVMIGEVEDSNCGDG
jgi:hypothetical protein